MTSFDKTKRILKTLQLVESTNKRPTDKRIEKKGRRGKVCPKFNVLVRPFKISHNLAAYDTQYKKKVTT